MATKFIFICLVFIALHCINALPVQNSVPKFESKCGYDKCPKSYDESKLNVHIIAQTHDDVGWKRTVDQYYYNEVQYILDSVVHELNRDPNRKFIYVEMAFFFKWWKEQNENTRNTVKRLVENGQLEFTNGGWSMNDEASPFYQQIIDQMTWGFRRLNDTFGECATPRIGWHIDPFGHSKEQASLFAQMNFDAFFFTRLDHQDREQRLNNNTLEFVWRANEDLGKASDILTGLVQLGYGYGSPPGFCWDLRHCSTEKINDPFIDDPNSEDYNVKQKVNDFLIYVLVFGQKYTTKHVFVTLGSDFQFLEAQSYFKNIDKLIKYVNENGNVNAFYSTPMCYAQAVQQSKKVYTTTKDDFFPYGSDAHSYWTGYFTSRPALKYNDRTANNFLQVCKQLNALSMIGRDDDTVMLKEALGVNQHHDAVSGTSKQHVAFDYARRMAKGVIRCQSVVTSALTKLMPKTSVNSIPIDFCPLLNISFCSITENSDKVALNIYNPLARSIEQYIRIPVIDGTYQLLDYNSQSVSFEKIAIADYVIAIPDRLYAYEFGVNATQEIVFKATLPPLGYVTYFLKKTSSTPSNTETVNKVNSAFTLNGKTISVNFNAKGELESIKLGNGQSVSVKQSFLYYKSFLGDNKKVDNRSSGAYIFRPNGTVVPISYVNFTARVSKNAIVQEVQQNITDYVWQTIRVYPSEDYIEFDWVVGPIPVRDDDIGKEIITRFDSNLKTNGYFYTDSNGRQILERRRNFNPTYRVNVSESVAQNYYPINSRIYMNDKTQDLQMTFLNDRSQGGGSLQDGSIEIMLHRRILHDDGFGVDEELNEPGADYTGLVVRGKTIVYVSKIADEPKFSRDMVQRINWPPMIAFVNYTTESDYSSKYKTMESFVVNALPNNVNLLTLEEWKTGSVLLRLEHFYSAKDDPNGLSKSVTVDLSKLFKPFTVKAVRETSLGGNQYLDNARKRLEFQTETPSEDKQIPNTLNGFSVTLVPMQIRTFIVSI